MQLATIEKVPEVRAWLLDNIDRDSLVFLDDDAAWAFITDRWPRITSHDAESLLGEAMKNIPETSN